RPVVDASGSRAPPPRRIRRRARVWWISIRRAPARSTAPVPARLRCGTAGASVATASLVSLRGAPQRLRGRAGDPAAVPAASPAAPLLSPGVPLAVQSAPARSPLGGRRAPRDPAIAPAEGRQAGPLEFSSSAPSTRSSNAPFAAAIIARRRRGVAIGGV